MQRRDLLRIIGATVIGLATASAIEAEAAPSEPTLTYEPSLTFDGVASFDGVATKLIVGSKLAPVVHWRHKVMVVDSSGEVILATDPDGVILVPESMAGWKISEPGES